MGTKVFIDGDDIIITAYKPRHSKETYSKVKKSAIASGYKCK